MKPHSTQLCVFKSSAKALVLLLFCFSTSIEMSAQCPTSHEPKSICGFDDVIDTLVFNGLPATNSSCSGPYGYYNSASTFPFSAAPGSTVNVSAKLGAGYVNQGLGIWIDFNNDHLFSPSEFVFSAGPDTSVSGQITIPSNAIATKVRMRVMAANGRVPLSQDACALPAGYGETEDYDLQILPTVQNNAAVLDLVSPDKFCAGVQDIRVLISNLGTNQLDSVQVHWEFNGVLQNPVNYIGLLDTLNGFSSQQQNILLGSKAFNYGTAYTIKAWTSLPNGTADASPFDDTVMVQRKAAIAGNFTLNANLPASASNYTDFSSFAYDVNSFGVCGPVYLTVAPGTYHETISFNNVFGTSDTNTITIDGQDSSMVLLSHDGTLNDYTVSVLDADFLRFKNIGIEFLGVNAGSVISLDRSSNIQISNCLLLMDATAGSFDLIGIFADRSPSSNILIANNQFEGGAVGVHFQGNSPAFNLGNAIIGNSFKNIMNRGLFLQKQDSLSVISNDIDVKSRGFVFAYGIEISDGYSWEISENEIHASDVGMRISNFSGTTPQRKRSKAINNMVLSSNLGMEFTGVDSMDFFHNSIAVFGNGAALNIMNWDTLPKSYDLRNNIFYSESGYAFKSSDAIHIFDLFDYNNFYTTSTNLMRIQSSDYSDLLNFQNAFPGWSNNSIQGNPQFVSNTNDLHIVGTLVDGKGDNTVGVSTDIDGDQRPLPLSFAVDIGADEFDPPSCPKPHSLFAQNPRIDSMTIGWKGNAIDFRYLIIPADSLTSFYTLKSANSDTVEVGNLLPSTNYLFYVREICARNDTSAWAGPLYFRTAEVLDYKEDFEGFSVDDLPFNWKSFSYPSNPSLSWTVDTSTAYASVIKDHTSGSGGHFAYFKTNFGPGEAMLKSAPIYFGAGISTFTLSFWYYMHGNDMGDLKVYIDTNLITTISGQQQTSTNDPWLYFDTTLSGYNSQYVHVKFVGSKGFGVSSEIAVDDVLLDSILVVGIDENSSGAGEVLIYPNPSSGSFKIILPDSKNSWSMKLISSQGKLIMEQDMVSSAEKQVQLYMQGLPKGVYYVKLDDGLQQIVKKVILME